MKKKTKQKKVKVLSPIIIENILRRLIGNADKEFIRELKERYRPYGKV